MVFFYLGLLFTFKLGFIPIYQGWGEEKKTGIERRLNLKPWGSRLNSLKSNHSTDLCKRSLIFKSTSFNLDPLSRSEVSILRNKSIKIPWFHSLFPINHRVSIDGFVMEHSLFHVHGEHLLWDLDQTNGLAVYILKLKNSLSSYTFTIKNSIEMV